MFNSRRHAYFAAVLLAALLPSLPESPAQPTPAPKGAPPLRLVQAGEVKVTGLLKEGAAVIDEDTVVLVGTKWNGGEDDLDRAFQADEPNGAIVDLSKKTSRPFTNGHTNSIHGVSAARGRVATVSNHREAVLRVWDVKAEKTVAAVEIEKPDDQRFSGYGVAWFHKSDRVAIAADEQVIVLDPARPDDRLMLRLPAGTRVSLDGPAVSPDDAWVACTAIFHQDDTANCAGLVFWDVAKRKETAISLLPKGLEDPRQWRTHSVAFGPTGTLFVCHGGFLEMPKAEADVPADRWGVARVELPGGRVTPLRMGRLGGPSGCAIDPTGTWLAAADSGKRDKPRADGDNTVGELRVYHLPSGSLAFREQVEGLPLSWVAFTPSGKRVVAAHSGGAVRWWDVKGP